ncbi:cell wall anchor protein [Actinoplanes nipponensis]|uniref:LPXTG-motif cell wall anchor domain-containing protein n=1 Tax=Actinoplanes nipponensis TaxID=135950 RepID=A0A919MPT6_9ACTN|nr:cell wall anchor protein [Actinoplanes nipponensis]GIE52941.1 hypothetical protein Ani05nite_64750 [Actinoplanes nipponensis]
MLNLLHRAAAIAAGALLGLTTVLAGPAHADAPTPQTDITGAAACVAGEWVVTWTITNNWTEQAKVGKLTTAPASVPGLDNGLYLYRRSESGTVGKNVFTQVLRGSPPSASVSFVAEWAKTKDRDNTATVQLGQCDPPERPCVEKAQARFHHEFAIKEGEAKATVSLDGDVKLCAAEPVTLVTYFAPKPQFSVPQYAFAHQSATISNEDRTVTLSAKLPDCYTQADLFFGGEDDVIEEITEGGRRYDDRKLGSRTGLGARSQGKPGWYNGGAKGCHQPLVQPVSQCDGTVDVNLSNPGEQTKYAVDFTVRAGDFTRTVTVAPGQGDTVRVPAGSGPVTVTADDMDDVTYTWTRPGSCPAPVVTVENDCKTVAVTVTNPRDAVPARATVAYGAESKQLTVAPGASERALFTAGEATEATVTIEGREPVTVSVEQPDCDSPGDGGPGDDGSGGGAGDGTPGDGGNDGGLPVTGAAAGVIAAGAAVLLLGGGVLFLVARRRRITFTP